MLTFFIQQGGEFLQGYPLTVLVVFRFLDEGQQHLAKATDRQVFLVEEYQLLLLFASLPITLASRW